MLRTLLLILCLPVSALRAEKAAQEASVHGVVASFRQRERTDRLVVPSIALQVEWGQAPTAFLMADAFTCEFTGEISVELRASYTFSVFVNGRIELLINGAPVLDFTGNGAHSEPSKAIRLNRGKNEIIARFTGPATGNAALQLFWASKNQPLPRPLPREVLSCKTTSAELLKQNSLREGLHLLAAYRCTKCHISELRTAPEFQQEAPDFTGIGSRLNEEWMARWIENPTAPQAHMPRLFSSEQARESAGALAAYLASLRDATEVRAQEGSAPTGEQLFHDLNCAACHSPEERSLEHVKSKFQPGALARYLLDPQADYPWNPMPNFKLTSTEANNLAAFLNGAEKRGSTSKAIFPASGKDLLERSGCLACHRSPAQNRFSAPTLVSIAQNSSGGCLSSGEAGSSPRFAFKKGEREALRSFLANGDFSSLGRIVPSEFAARQITELRCAACHDKIEGIPHLSAVGGKLKPEWSARFIGGQIANRPRPWLHARMPAFPAQAELLARGLANLNGVSAQTAPEPPLDPELADIGAKLVSAAGGFSCVACHPVGKFSGGQVVESPGVNFAYSAERLLPSYFHRWVMNPLGIDPATKMPVYFDAQGRSQLTEFFEGDGAKQISAIWQYLRLGPKMPPPPLP